MSKDTLWFAFADHEVFVVLDEQLQERYANRSISRLGFGRKFSYNWRAEFVYALWHSRDNMEQERDDNDLTHVLRFSLKYYITPPNRRLPRPTLEE